MRPFLNPMDPFFAKPWRRWATALVPAAWGLFEFWSGNPFWGILFITAGGYAYYILILTRPKDSE